MVNRRMGNRSITSLRSRRRQTTVSHSRAGLNTDSRNSCRTASRSNTDNDSSSAYDEGKKKDIVDQMADLNLNDIEYGSADHEKLQDLHAKMSDIDSPTLDQSDLQKAAKEADLSGSLKDLETTLSEKIK